jgi:LmbE family N-acetylglucosaminyl deacetylase
LAALAAVAVMLDQSGRQPVRAALSEDATAVAVSSSTRAVVIAPHPDDAVLGAGGLIQRIVRNHGSVEIVEMTSGDAFAGGVVALRPGVKPTSETYRHYGSLREREVVQAMRMLGVARSRIRLLGFPDDGLCELAAHRVPAIVFASPYTGRDSPPSSQRLHATAMYRGDDVRRELERIFLAFRPTLAVLPHSRDEHPDHCATHVLAHEALKLAVEGGLHAPHLLHYVIHSRGWPGREPRPSFAEGATWRSLRLTPREQDGKRLALEAYRSQMAVMPAFLRAFVRLEEPFEAGDGDTAYPCWCRGQNIAPNVRSVQ